MNFVLADLLEQDCFFFACSDWVYDESLAQTDQLWEIANQIYLRPRRHQTFSFVLPFLVCELSLVQSCKYLRVFLIYGNEVSSMIGSATHFMGIQPGIKAWVGKLDFDLNQVTMCAIVNRLLENDSKFNSAQFFRYNEPHHKTLRGSWEIIH